MPRAAAFLSEILGDIASGTAQDAGSGGANETGAGNTSVAPTGRGTADSDRDSAYLNCFGWTVMSAIYAVVLHTWAMEAWRQGMEWRVAMHQLVYRKSLRISKASMVATTTGHIITLCSADSERMQVRGNIRALWDCYR